MSADTDNKNSHSSKRTESCCNRSATPFKGRTIPRREDERLLSGKGCYVGDVLLEDALHVAFLRSPFASGMITECDISEALESWEVIAVCTGADVAKLGNLSVNPILKQVNPPDYPILAIDRVFAVGQPVAAVIAETRHYAMDAAETICLDVNTGNAALEMADTAAEDAALFTDIPDNIAAAQSWREGHIEDAFARADHIVEASVQHPRLAPSPMEPRAAAARFDPATGKLTVWLSTQTPHRSRQELAKILDFPIPDIRVIAPDVGGAFGMKASLYPEDVFVAWAALQLTRPVRWTATRGEDLLAATHGRGATSQGSLALARNGRFLALKADFACPLGHWMPNSAAIPAWNAGRILPGPYDIDTIDISTRAVLTNTAPVGIYRGAGRPEAAVLMERLVDEAAVATGIDEAEIRRINLLQPERLPLQRPTGAKLDSGDYPKALEKLCALAGYTRLRRQQRLRRDNGELVGIGIACYVEPCGQGWESARITVNRDGTILAATGTSSQGHGRETAYAQIVADALETDPQNVTVIFGDTETTPEGIGALASRSTAIGGSALLQAARKVRKKSAAIGGHGESVTAEVVYHADNEAWGSGCYLAIVGADKETGVLTVEKMICIDDAGNLINPMLVEGQIVGGIAQGLGEALMEQIRYNKDGQLLTGSLMDYALPRACDIPPIEIATMSTPSQGNLLGAKGVGEAGTIGAPAAILNAAIDALRPLGVTELTMPLTSEKIWQAMTAAQKDNKT